MYFEHKMNKLWFLKVLIKVPIKEYPKLILHSFKSEQFKQESRLSHKVEIWCTVHTLKTLLSTNEVIHHTKSELGARLEISPPHYPSFMLYSPNDSDVFSSNNNLVLTISTSNQKQLATE